ATSGSCSSRRCAAPAWRSCRGRARRAGRRASGRLSPSDLVEPVSLVRTAPTPTAVVAEATTWDEFPSRWPQLLDEVWAFVRRTGLEAGRNVMVYKDDRPNVEVGVEVARPFAGDERV